MKITGISIAPIYPNKIIGGSQKVLMDLFSGLGEKGHELNILSTKTNEINSKFYFNKVLVDPVLNFRGMFPSTHHFPPYKLLSNLKEIENQTEQSDVVYLHADALYLRPNLNTSKVIRSFHDYFYEESILSSLLLSSNKTVVPSNYLKNCIETIVLMSGLRNLEQVNCIPNGVFNNKAIKDSKFLTNLKNKSKEDLFVLFPHRPTPEKGLINAIEITKKLQKKLLNRRVKLLVPFYSNESVFDESNFEINSIKKIIKEYDAEDIILLHDWLNIDQMSSYLSIGDVVISPGNFIESFGLIPLESIYNLTPVVCFKVGALRDLSEIPGIFQVKFNEIDTFVDSILDAINIDETILIQGKKYIESNYSTSSMVNKYEELFLSINYKKNNKFIFQNKLTLSPWSYIENGSIFNDYTSKFYKYPKLFKYFFSNGKFIINIDEILSEDLLYEIDLAKRDGCITNLIGSY